VSTSYLRPNFVEIDLAAIRRCTQAIRDAIGPSVKFFGTLKANGYGFGLVPVAKTVLAAGADAISLISLADAIALREAGIASPILLYAGVPYDRESVRAIERYRITPTLHDEASFDALLGNLKDQLDCAIKIDAGNERIGVASDIAGEYIARVARSGKLRVTIVNTHPSITGACARGRMSPVAIRAIRPRMPRCRVEGRSYSAARDGELEGLAHDQDHESRRRRSGAGIVHAARG
jgi:alanine racemase